MSHVNVFFFPRKATVALTRTQTVFQITKKLFVSYILILSCLKYWFWNHLPLEKSTLIILTQPKLNATILHCAYEPWTHHRDEMHVGSCGDLIVSVASVKRTTRLHHMKMEISWKHFVICSQIWILINWKAESDETLFQIVLAQFNHWFSPSKCPFTIICIVSVKMWDHQWW